MVLVLNQSSQYGMSTTLVAISQAITLAGATAETSQIRHTGAPL
jgi:hypothetical protein